MIEAAKSCLQRQALSDGRVEGAITSLERLFKISWDEAAQIVGQLEQVGFLLPRSARPDGYRSLASPPHQVATQSLYTMRQTLKKKRDAQIEKRERMVQAPR